MSNYIINNFNELQSNCKKTYFSLNDKIVYCTKKAKECSLENCYLLKECLCNNLEDDLK